MNKKIRSVLAILLCAATLFTLCACSQETPVDSTEKTSDDNKLKVVCTLFPQYDFVREIAGDKVDLTLLLPPGVESHSYDPTPADIKAVTDADLVIRVGKEMETWSEKLFSSTSSKAVFMDLSHEICAEITEHVHDHEAEGEFHSFIDTDVAFFDPHLWTDPTLSFLMVAVIADKLCEMDAENASFYTENAENYLSELEALNTEITELVKSSERKTLVFSGRFALQNFTEQYGLKAIAALDACADNSEPSAATVAQIIDTIKSENIKVVFYEELIEPKTAKIICDETGAKMLLFHSCHNLSKDEFNSGETYLSLMKQNVKNLEEALKLTKKNCSPAKMPLSDMITMSL